MTTATVNNTILFSILPPSGYTVSTRSDHLNALTSFSRYTAKVRKSSYICGGIDEEVRNPNICDYPTKNKELEKE